MALPRWFGSLWLTRFSRPAGERPIWQHLLRHQRLTSLAKVQLVPGNADSALARVSNHLGVFDLVLVSADDEPKHLERSWFFVQRLVRPTSTILVEPSLGRSWEPLHAAGLDALASRTVQRRAA